MPPGQVQRFLEEQSGMQLTGFQYEPWVLFRNPEYHGQFLNTDARGLRRKTTARAPCSNPVRVFVFGGSTTFGYGVADEETIPAQLAAQLANLLPGKRVSVYNLATPNYVGIQERIQLEQLLLNGHAP